MSGHVVVPVEACDSHTLSRFPQPTQEQREQRCRQFGGNPSLGFDGWNRCLNCLGNGQRAVLDQAVAVAQSTFARVHGRTGPAPIWIEVES